jgi:hypothetical protein
MFSQTFAILFTGENFFSILVMQSRTTLKKISANLNLSVSTVSRALKNHPDISEDTKSKVKELASLMEYEPNTYPINLRINFCPAFGLILPDRFRAWRCEGNQGTSAPIMPNTCQRFVPIVRRSSLLY